MTVVIWSAAAAVVVFVVVVTHHDLAPLMAEVLLLKVWNKLVHRYLLEGFAGFEVVHHGEVTIILVEVAQLVGSGGNYHELRFKSKKILMNQNQ